MSSGKLKREESVGSLGNLDELLTDDSEDVKPQVQQENVSLLRDLRRSHERQTPQAFRNEKFLDHLWTEFGELLKSAESTPQQQTMLSALQQERKRLANRTQMHLRKSELEAARAVVQARQKRRKIKRSNSHKNVTKCLHTIQPWHIVLGDHSNRDRTFATLALRYFCVEVKDAGIALQEKEVLRKTRTFLQIAFPGTPVDEVGMILYAWGKTSSRFVDLPVEQLDEYSFGEDDKHMFVPVALGREAEVVKHLYTKMTPTSERSLQEVARAYRTLLDSESRVTCQDGGSKLKEFKSLLDFCEQAEQLALTQTAINGLRESLDNKWADLVA